MVVVVVVAVVAASHNGDIRAFHLTATAPQRSCATCYADVVMCVAMSRQQVAVMLWLLLPLICGAWADELQQTD
jgi:hypothetical protein